MGNNGGNVPAMSVYEAHMQADHQREKYMRNRTNTTGAQTAPEKQLVVRRILSDWSGEAR